MSSDPVTLKVTNNQFEADALVNMLELEGINSMVRSADMLTHMNGGLSSRMVVLVLPSDLDAARALIESAEL